MVTLLLYKAKRAPIGAKSRDGKRRKVAEGKWVPVKSVKDIPKKITEKTPAVPPSWQNVQYFTDPDSKLLVKGEDAKGRTQYVYNPQHVTEASKEKFARINDLNNQFDQIKEQVDSDAAKGVPEAMALSLIMATGIRPGSEKQTSAEKEAFGATTLQGQHVKVGKDGVRLEFIGKKGVDQWVAVDDPDTARMLKRLKKKAGATGKLFGITGDQLLKYTRSLGGGAGFQSKDFRTHLGTEIAMQEMRGKRPKTMSEYKQAVRDVADAVAEKLGNTRKVVLSSYINPAIFEKWRRKIEST